jgi:hypothetical protein
MSANSPQYFGNSLRMIMRNGLWIGQRCYGRATREYDPWQAITRPSDYETILARMRSWAPPAPTYRDEDTQ